MSHEFISEYASASRLLSQVKCAHTKTKRAETLAMLHIAILYESTQLLSHMLIQVTNPYAWSGSGI